MKRYPLCRNLLVGLVVFSLVLIGQRLKGDQLLWLFAPFPFLGLVSVMMQIKYERWRARERYKGLSTLKGRA